MPEARKTDRSYWAEKLRGDSFASAFPPELASDRPYQPASISHGLDAELSARIIAVANRSDQRLFAICAAGVAILLRKYAGYNDVLINTTILRQDRDGPFINMLLPLRFCFDPTQTGRDVILAAAREIREAADHQNFPTRALQSEYPRNDSARLFRVFVLLDALHDRRYLAGSRPDMTFLFSVDHQQVQAELTYDASRYAAGTMQRLLQHLEAGLRFLVVTVDEAIGRLRLGPEPRARAGRIEGSECIVDSFDRRVAECPERIAVADETRSLTYAELACRSDEVARQCGDGDAGRIIAFAAGRSVDTIVGIIGILKVGAAYLPIDLGASESRTRSMMRACGADTILMTEEVARSELALKADARQVYVVGKKTDERAGWSPRRRVRPEDAAYLMYTSGSTGSPKGVLVEHRSVTALAVALGADVLSSDRPSRVAMIAPYTFDGSIKQIFGSLLNGHSLFIIPEAGRREPRALFDFINRFRIDVVDGTPTHLRQWVAAMKRNLLPSSVRRFLIGGELLPTELADEFLSNYAHAKCELVNVYGPTECCDVTTIAKLDDLPTQRRRSVPIGRPLPSSHVEVMDIDGQLSPPGPVGEIVIAGEGVGRGYILAESEVQSAAALQPLAGPDGWYATGDLGRWLEDGQLEFIGRKDRQLKIRGFRIDPGEIESAIRDATGGSECAVVAFGRAGSLSLCAYYVSKAGPFDTDTSRQVAPVAHANPGTVALQTCAWDPREVGEDVATVLVLCGVHTAAWQAARTGFNGGTRLVGAGPGWPAHYLRFIAEAERCRAVVVDRTACKAAQAALSGLDLRWIVLEEGPDTDGGMPGMEDCAGTERVHRYPEPGQACPPAYVKWWLERMLPAFMVPSHIVAVNRLPLTPSGKLDYRQLPDPTAAIEVYVAPANDIERRIVEIWAPILGLESRRIGRNSKFLDLGGNSLSATLLLIELQSAFGVEIPLGELFEKQTVAELAEYLGTLDLNSRPSSGGQIVLISRGADPKHILCLVHDGLGQIESYVGLSEGGTAPVDLAACRPDRNEALAPFDVSIDALAGAYSERLLDMAGGRDLLLGGWSIGGLIAFAMACHLEERGVDVRYLGLMDIGPRIRSTTNNAVDISIQSESRFVTTVFPDLSGLPDGVSTIEELWSAVAAKLDAVGVSPSNVLRRIVGAAGLPSAGLTEPRGIRDAIRRGNLTRSLIRAQGCYQPERAVKCAIDLFRAVERRDDVLSGWERFTLGGLAVHDVPGDHFGMIRKPNVSVLGDALFRSIARSLEADDAPAGNAVMPAPKRPLQVSP